MTATDKQVDLASLQTMRKVSFDTHAFSKRTTFARCVDTLHSSSSSSSSINDNIFAPKFLEQWNARLPTLTVTSTSSVASKKRPISVSGTHHSSTSSSSAMGMSSCSRKLSRLSRSGCLKALVHESDGTFGGPSTSSPHHGNTSCRRTSAVPSVSDDDLFSNSNNHSRSLSEGGHEYEYEYGHGHEYGYEYDSIDTTSSALSSDPDLAFAPLAFSPGTASSSSSSSSSSSPPSTSSSSSEDSARSCSSTPTYPCSGWGHFVDVVPTMDHRTSARDRRHVPRKSRMTTKKLTSFRRRYKSFSPSLSSPSKSKLQSKSQSQSPKLKHKHRRAHKLRCVDTISTALNRMSF